MHNDQQNAEVRLSTLLAEIILYLAAELKEARSQRLSHDDIALLGEMLADSERRAVKLEQLDAQTPPVTEAPAQ